MDWVGLEDDLDKTHDPFEFDLDSQILDSKYDIKSSQGEQVFLNELEYTSEVIDDEGTLWWTFKSPSIYFFEQDFSIKMVRQEWHFLVCLWFKQADREEALWAEEQMTDLEETYFNPFDLQITESFDDASKV